MEYLVGALLALATGLMANLVGFDRERGFYPVVLIVVASYYCLFAAMAGGGAPLWLDGGIAMLFAATAIVSFRASLWLAAAGLAAHGAMDLVHHDFVANPGVPPWWPGFCSSFDLVFAACLATLLLRRSLDEARTPSPHPQAVDSPFQ